MPKQTFFNLPEDKQRLIEEVAVDEFAGRGYAAASISQIVSRAGIAKGSFYQYFEDKHDLFMHLVNRVTEEKHAYFKDCRPPDPGIDFFANLRWMFEAGFAYAAAQSRLNQAVSRVLFGEGLFMGEMFKEARQASAQMFVEMLQQAAERGDIDANVDPTVAAFAVETLLNSLGLFILNQQAVSQEVLQQGRIDWLTSEQARQIVDNMLFVLEHGLRKKTDG
ncbi:MAG: TetR/AcrR family transcriptional regulator [Anaerolineae bacterium]|nr:TetR/AcrR family transcriptional regulator [Anaerolineae bacterium]